MINFEIMTSIMTACRSIAAAVMHTPLCTCAAACALAAAGCFIVYKILFD